MSKIVGDAI